MEVRKFITCLVLMLILASCSNTPDLETGEIKTLSLLKEAFLQSNQPKQFIDARILLNRKQIDESKTPVLFVQLPTGQNGTLVPYPGQGIGQTWLGADGATITLDRGILKASRGMGDDLMGSFSSMPAWSDITEKVLTYGRVYSHITGNNQISKSIFECEIRKTRNKVKIIEIWDIKFNVVSYEENCHNNLLKIKNTFYVDTRGIVRRSSQWHGNTIGYILLERLDK